MSELSVAISLIIQHVQDILSNGNRYNKRRRTSTFEPAVVTTSLPRPRANNPPRRHMMTSSISLPAGNPNLIITQHERTPPRFMTQEGIDLMDLNPFQAEVMRHLGDSNFQMRPH